MPRANDPATAYRSRQEDIRLLLLLVQERVAKHAREAMPRPCWGAVGDLETIRERLIATLVSLSGDRSEVSAQRQIETLMVEHRGRSPITQADGSTAWIPIPTT